MLHLSSIGRQIRNDLRTARLVFGLALALTGALVASLRTRAARLVICLAVVAAGVLGAPAVSSAYLHAENAKSFALNKTWYGNWSPSAFCDTWNHCRAFPALAGDSHRMTNGDYWVNVRKYTASGANCEAGIQVTGNDGSERLPDGWYVWGWIC